MNISEPTGSESFHKFVGQQLASEDSALMSPDEALAFRRQEQETLAAIGEGLDDVASGRTKSVEDFDRDFLARHSIPA
jgi:hypothetical protein